MTTIILSVIVFTISLYNLVSAIRFSNRIKRRGVRLAVARALLERAELMHKRWRTTEGEEKHKYGLECDLLIEQVNAIHNEET